MSKVLVNVANYSKERISLDNINVQNYVTTDNLLQNKQGKVEAEKMPKQMSNTVTRYDENDILIANIRPYLKKIWFANCSGGSSSDVLTLKVKKGYNPKFIYYSLFRDEFFDYMMAGSKGTKMPRGDKNQILDFPIPNFELNDQKQIAKVLSDLDAKIEVNNKINQELEGLAKTIYDYWFFQFDFPDQNGKPYKSSGGKMEYNEELKREIPEGWELKMLNKIFEFEKGKEPGSDEYMNEKIDENYIKFFRFGNIDGISDTFIDSTKQDYLYATEGDVIVTFDGSVGKVGIGINGIYSSGLRKIYSITDEFHSSFIYFVFKDERIIKTIHKYSTGSIILHASKSIDFLNIVYHKETVEKYQNFINPLYEKIVSNLRENQKLAALRDWLLPMLMNGQVTVGEAKEHLVRVTEENGKYGE